MTVFSYGKKEMDYLKKSDKMIANIIDEVGVIERSINESLFTSIIYSVIGQQISDKAAQTVCKRFDSLVGEITPNSVASHCVSEIRKCGMSQRKAEYILGVAQSGIDFEGLKCLGDEEIMKTLSRLKGIGEWTVEMLLIFSLGRKDILSYNDLAIRRGIMKLHDLEELSKAEFKKYKQMYSPYGTVASFYLWEIAHR